MQTYLQTYPSRNFSQDLAQNSRNLPFVISLILFTFDILCVYILQFFSHHLTTTLLNYIYIIYSCSKHHYLQKKCICMISGVCCWASYSISLPTIICAGNENQGKIRSRLSHLRGLSRKTPPSWKFYCPGEISKKKQFLSPRKAV